MKQPFKNLTPKEFKKKIKFDQNALIIDVRTLSEVREGYIPQSIHIDINEPDFDYKIDKLAKDKSYYVYCRSGNRSILACLKMCDKGFEYLYNLSGGILEWRGEKITNNK